MADNELVARLSALAGIIMEDNSPLALSVMPTAGEEVDARLRVLEQACQDASTLVQAAQVLIRRDLR